MIQFAAQSRRTTRRALISSFIAALVVVLTATNSSAAGPGNYRIVPSRDGHFLTLTQNNLATTPDTDDEVFYLSTSGSGANRLPFALRLYNGVFRNVAVSSNGNIQLGVTETDGGSDEWDSDCLYSATIIGPAVFPLWDDLRFDLTDTTRGYPEGIFVKTLGSAPHRTFIVSWQGFLFDAPTVDVKAQAVFREGSPNVTFVYGADGGNLETIGVQSSSPPTRFKQWSCDSGSNMAVRRGGQLTFVHVN